MLISMYRHPHGCNGHSFLHRSLVLCKIMIRFGWRRLHVLYALLPWFALVIICIAVSSVKRETTQMSSNVLVLKIKFLCWSVFVFPVMNMGHSAFFVLISLPFFKRCCRMLIFSVPSTIATCLFHHPVFSVVALLFPYIYRAAKKEDIA